MFYNDNKINLIIVVIIVIIIMIVTNIEHTIYICEQIFTYTYTKKSTHRSALTRRSEIRNEKMGMCIRRSSNYNYVARGRMPRNKKESVHTRATLEGRMSDLKSPMQSGWNVARLHIGLVFGGPRGGAPDAGSDKIKAILL